MATLFFTMAALAAFSVLGAIGDFFAALLGAVDPWEYR